MRVQHTDWGQIDWYDDTENSTGFKVGMVTIFSDSMQPEHIHYDEQVIYVTEGTCYSEVDGEPVTMKAGDIYLLKAGVIHMTRNTSGRPFRHLLVTDPAEAEEDASLFSEPRSFDMAPDLLVRAVEGIRTQFLEPLNYGYAIFDAAGNLILQGDIFPTFCAKHCTPLLRQGTCPCMRQLRPYDWREEQIFTCPYGLEVYHYPVIYAGYFLGYIQGGYFRHSVKTGAGRPDGSEQMVYDSPDNVRDGVRALLKRIARALRIFCEFDCFRRSIEEREMALASEKNKQVLLQQNLRNAEYAVTDLKINNHFLFNTLNSIASMALDAGDPEIYESIVDLSTMFRYTLSTQSSVVPLSNELAYVRSYVKLQKLRYGDDLEVQSDIEGDVSHLFVPFNFLQPVVENAFTHGFHDHIRKQLILNVRMAERLEITVINNTEEPLTEEECRQINRRIRSNSAHGLSMVYQKLQSYYDKPVLFAIRAMESGSTCFDIRLPLTMRDQQKGAFS